MRDISQLLFCHLILVSGSPLDEFKSSITNHGTYALDEKFGRFIETRISLGAEITDEADFPEIRPPYVGVGPKRPDGSPFGELHIEKEIVTTMTGSIQEATIVNPEDEAESSQRVAVKYYNDCYERSENIEGSDDWIVNNYRYLRLFNETGIVPRVYYLSGVSDFPHVFDPNAPYIGHFALRHYDQCVRLKSQVSYMVQELVGPSIASYLAWLNGRMGKHTDFTKTVLVLARKAIDLLDVVYRFGVVHGDIHLGNIAFKHPVESFEAIVPEASELVLLDFKFGDFYPSNINKPEEVSDNLKGKAANTQSHWELSGFRTGPRDDVYRLLRAVALALSRGRMSMGENRLVQANMEAAGNPPIGSKFCIQTEREIHKYIKSELSMFTYSIPLASSALIGDNISAADRAQVQKTLEKIANHVKAAVSPDEEPDYSGIAEAMDQVIRYINNAKRII